MRLLLMQDLLVFLGGWCTSISGMLLLRLQRIEARGDCHLLVEVAARLLERPWCLWLMLVR